MLRPDELREHPFQLADFRAHDVLAMLEDARDALVDGGPEATVLALEIDEIHGAASAVSGWRIV